MANEGDPGQTSESEGGRLLDPAAALEARVAQLEFDLASLRRQLAGERPVAPESLRRARPAFAPPPKQVALRVDAPIEASAVAEPRFRNPIFQAAPPRTDSLQSFENRLGSQIFNRVAIVLLLIGTAYGLKLAVDRGWIGPTGRVLAGLIGGTALVVWSERFRHKGFAAFSYSLKAVGSGVLYLTLWAAFQIFHLLPASATLAMMVLVTAWNAYMAWAQNSELLAAYALAGGLATPLLVSTGGNHEVFLFTYLFAIDVATVALVRIKEWPRLLVGAFPATAVFFFGWYIEYYAAAELTLTSAFVALFGIVFASVPIAPRVTESTTEKQHFRPLHAVLNSILLPLANAAFVALAFYFIVQDAGHHALLPWLMVVLGAAYLALMRAPQTTTASAIHLSLAVVFLTIAVPLKASGHWITVSWLVEGLALIWIATRLPNEGPEASISRTLHWLGAGSLALGFGGVVTHCVDLIAGAQQPLFNSDAATALVGMAIFAAAAWIALRASGSSLTPMAMAAFIAIDAVAFLLALREIVSAWGFDSFTGQHLPLRSADFLTALAGLAVFAAVVAVSRRIARTIANDGFWPSCAAVSTIAFNLIAVLAGVREVSALWSVQGLRGADADLQQALAISGFLMLYGAALLAIGFWKRSGFLRWQALLLLIFTIFKTFLYDMRNLSQGYRVVSVLGLGILLMAISFAYQKDWLHLRESEPNRGPEAIQ